MQLEICGAEACIGPSNLGSRERLAYMKARESLWLNMDSLSVVTHRRNPGPSRWFSDSDDGLFWVKLGISMPNGASSGGEAVRAFQICQPMGESTWRDFAINEDLENIRVIYVCLDIQEHDLIAIFTLPDLM